MALSSSSAAEPNVTRASRGPAPVADAISGPLPASSTASSIRALAHSARAEAARELADLSLSPDVTKQAADLLLAIRVLSRFAHDPVVQKALLRHLQRPQAGDEPELRALARRTCAHALASASEPDGLRTLVLLASGPVDTDPELAGLAREALTAYPPSPGALAGALPWLKRSERQARLRFVSDAKSAGEQRRLELCRGAQRGFSALPGQAAPAAARLLANLTACPHELQPSQEAWTKLGQVSVVWALRGMAALGVGGEDEAWQERAERALTDDDPIVRSAAAWFLATNGAAERLAKERHSEVRAAARNQLLTNTPSESDGSCSLGATSSTVSLLRRLGSSHGEDDGLLFGCLASRIQAAPGPGPSALEVEAWLRDAKPADRIHTVRGLAHVRPDRRALALGLAERLYAGESDDYVRRFVCLTMRDLGAHPGSSSLEDLRIDPDPVCRAIGRGESASIAGVSTFVAATKSERLLALRTGAPPVMLEPAPDGFVGARVVRGAPSSAMDDRHFVDCRESAEPAWACGPTQQKPR